MQRRQSHHIVVAFVVDLRDVRDRERLHDITHGNLMRRLLATMSNCTPALAPALLALFMMPLPSDVARSDSSAPDAEAAATPSATPCAANDTVVYQPNPSTGSEPGCATPARTAAEIADARAYLIETANPGFTMTLQGAELAIGRLHPEFVVRLANAIREARSAGMPFAGVFSAYRPPAFGVGGFSDKFNSLHTYGLAVDMHGIGRPGSPEAQLWHETAARNGVVCPYGPRDRAEWNHCQPTSVKIILAENPLRETVRAEGPSDLESMFEAGNTIIADMASAADSVSKAAPASVRALEAVAYGRDSIPQIMASRRTGSTSPHASGRLAMGRLAMGRLALAHLSAERGSSGRAAGKSARHATRVAGIGVGGPIIAVEEGRRGASSRQAKRGTRIVIGPTKITVVEKAERTSSSAKKAKHAMRTGSGVKPIIAEESRRKSKSGRG
jgi:hypothetical protein